MGVRENFKGGRGENNITQEKNINMGSSIHTHTHVHTRTHTHTQKHTHTMTGNSNPNFLCAHALSSSLVPGACPPN